METERREQARPAHLDFGGEQQKSVNCCRKWNSSTEVLQEKTDVLNMYT